MLTPLKTLNGSRIWYAKRGVGKKVGSKIYVAIQYLPEICEPGLIKEAKMILNDHGVPYKSFRCACYDIKNPCVIRFDTCPGFDTEDCPVVGYQYTIDTYNGRVKKKYCEQIFHHKWLWCREDYTGFDVQESYEYSKRWLSKFKEVASGYPWKWQEQLKKYGLN